MRGLILAAGRGSRMLALTGERPKCFVPLHGKTLLEWQPSDQYGFPLPVTHAVWIAGAVLLYFPCRWFAKVKARRRDWWLSYL